MRARLGIVDNTAMCRQIIDFVYELGTEPSHVKPCHAFRARLIFPCFVLESDIRGRWRCADERALVPQRLQLVSQSHHILGEHKT